MNRAIFSVIATIFFLLGAVFPAQAGSIVVRGYFSVDGAVQQQRVASNTGGQDFLYAMFGSRRPELGGNNISRVDMGVGTSVDRRGPYNLCKKLEASGRCVFVRAYDVGIAAKMVTISIDGHIWATSSNNRSMSAPVPATRRQQTTQSSSGTASCNAEPWGTLHRMVGGVPPHGKIGVPHTHKGNGASGTHTHNPCR